MAQHASVDGDVVLDIAVDAPFEAVSSGNRSGLNGWLRVEAVCQAPVVRYAELACARFKGTVPIPATGTRVQVTGSYVLDTNHGWMEIHPVAS